MSILHTQVFHNLVMDNKRLGIPDALSVLVNAAITAEETHAGNRRDCLLDPLLLVLVRLVHKLMSLVVAVEIVRYQVVVAMVTDGCNQSTEVMD